MVALWMQLSHFCYYLQHRCYAASAMCQSREMSILSFSSNLVGLELTKPLFGVKASFSAVYEHLRLIRRSQVCRPLALC